jgi:hypothetical protein
MSFFTIKTSRDPIKNEYAFLNFIINGSFFSKIKKFKKASSVAEAKIKKALCRIRINFISVDQYELNFMYVFGVLLIYSGSFG